MLTSDQSGAAQSRGTTPELGWGLRVDLKLTRAVSHLRGNPALETPALNPIVLVRSGVGKRTVLATPSAKRGARISHLGWERGCPKCARRYRFPGQEWNTEQVMM